MPQHVKTFASYALAAAAGVLAWWLMGRSVSGVTGLCALCRPSVTLTLGSLSGLYGMYLSRNP